MATPPLESQQSNLLPTVYFKKVTLENSAKGDVKPEHALPIIPPGGKKHPMYDPPGFASTEAITGTPPEYGDPSDPALSVTVDLEIKFEFNTTNLSKVVLDQNFLRFARIRLSLYGQLSEEEVPVEAATVDIPLKDYIGENTEIAPTYDYKKGGLNKYTPTLTDNGTLLLTIPVSHVFNSSIGNELDYLSFKAFCFLSLKEISDTYNIDEATLQALVKMDNAADEAAWAAEPGYARGAITTQAVIAGGKTIKTAYVYIIAPDVGKHAGEQWLGSKKMIQIRPDGLQPVETFVIDAPGTPYNDLRLNRKAVPIRKIIDLRFLDKISGEKTEFCPVENILGALVSETECQGVGQPATQIDNWFNDASPYSSATPRVSIGYGCIPDRSITVNPPDTYLSEAYISRDIEGNCRFLFHLDYDKLLREKSTFGGLINEANKQKIKNNSRILKLKVIRRRVNRKASINRLGSPVAGTATHEYDNLSEFIVESKDGKNGTLKPVFLGEATKGKIKEGSTLWTVSGKLLSDSGIRTFNVTDPSITGVPEDAFGLSAEPPGDSEVPRLIPPSSHDAPASPSGIFYQYGIELEIEDGTIAFLNSQLYSNTAGFRGLMSLRKELEEYYGNLEHFLMVKRAHERQVIPLHLQGTSTTYNLADVPASIANLRGSISQAPSDVDGSISEDTSYGGIKERIESLPLGPRFNHRRSQLKLKLPWNGVPQYLSQVIVNITSKTEDSLAEYYNKIRPLLMPENVTLGSINSVILLVDSMISKIERGLGNYLRPTQTKFGLKQMNVTSSPKRGVIILNKFFDNVFDASKPKDMHIDFFGEAGTTSSLYGMTTDAYTQRFNAETEMYWVSSDQKIIQSKTSIKAPYENEVFSRILDVDSTKPTFMTAAKISLGVNKKVSRLREGLKMWDTNPMVDTDGVRSTDKYSAATNIAVASNMGDFTPSGGSLADTSVEALKHTLSKLGVQVLRTPLPKVLQSPSNGINTNSATRVLVGDILGARSEQANENLHEGLKEGTTQAQRDFASSQKRRKIDFAAALPIVQKWANNVARNGAFVTQDSARRITNPHAVVPPPMKKKMYDVNSPNSIIEQMRKSNPDPEDAANLPGQVKAEIASSHGEATLQQVTDQDASQNPDSSAFFAWNFGLMARVEVLEGFEQQDCKTNVGYCKDILKRPIFKTLDGATWQIVSRKLRDNPENYILCRVVPESNSTIGIVPSPGLQLPILNEYFILSWAQVGNLPAIVTPSPSTGKDTVREDSIGEEWDTAEVAS